MQRKIRAGKGVYRKVRPNEELQFTWIWDDEDLDIGETLVTINLKSIGTQIELVLTHELLPTAEKREGHSQGWNGLLDSLGTYVAGDK